MLRRLVRASWFFGIGLTASCGRLGFEQLADPTSDGSVADGAAPMPGTFAALCAYSSAIVVTDTIALDASAGADLATALASACAPSLTYETRSETDTSVLEATTHRPIVGPSTLLVIGGGDFYQDAIAYLSQARTPVTRGTVGSDRVITSRTSGQTLVSVPTSQAGNTHDIGVVQVIIEPTSRSVVVNAYGLYDNGTLAAIYLFQHQIAPTLATDSNRFYAFEWTDDDGTAGPSSGDSFLVVPGS